MSTKKKTTKTTKTTKRSAMWQEYFSRAIQGFTANPEYVTFATGGDTVFESDMIHDAADIVKRAEKIADIATARNT